jgi:hypothetical protein
MQQKMQEADLNEAVIFVLAKFHIAVEVVS